MTRSNAQPRAIQLADEESRLVSRMRNRGDKEHHDYSSGDPWFRFENVAKDDDETDEPAEVYIYDQIGMNFWGEGVGAQDFVKEFSAIKNAEISVHVNSPGGDVFDGVAIYNAIRNHPSDVTIFVDGLAASAASFIAQAGDKIVMSKGSMMMVHDAAGFCMGTAKDMAEMGAVLDKVSDSIAGIYADSTGTEAGDWRALMSYGDVWYSDQEAVEAGLAHEVSGTAETTEGEAKNRWSSAFLNFKHQGRSDAPSPEAVKRLVVQNNMKEKSVPKAPGTTATTDFSVTMGETTYTDPEALQAALNDIYTASIKGQTLFLVNGVATGNFDNVQAHITTLETAQAAIEDNARKDFIASLARDNKIAASQMEGLESFVAGLSGEQYASWKNTWAEAPSSSIFARHTGADSTEPADEQSVSALQTAQDIVNHMLQGGMSQTAVEKTSAWAKLQQLQSQQKG